ncbi:MAG: hypothetical protein HFH73_09965 [Lachnospiraceae bacterium]|nr:hypothetical protein [Lachnospiraceae bacterium]
MPWNSKTAKAAEESIRVDYGEDAARLKLRFMPEELELIRRFFQKSETVW